MATRIGLDDMRGHKKTYQGELREVARILDEVQGVPGVVGGRIEYLVLDQVFERRFEAATRSLWRQEFRPARKGSIAQRTRMLGASIDERDDHGTAGK